MTNSISINGARGEIEVMIDGSPYRLCLTLGALAEIETALGCVSIEDLDGRLKSVSAGDILKIFEALLRGGGTSDAAVSLASKAMDVMGAAYAVKTTFSAARG